MSHYLVNLVRRGAGLAGSAPSPAPAAAGPLLPTNAVQESEATGAESAAPFESITVVPQIDMTPPPHAAPPAPSAAPPASAPATATAARHARVPAEPPPRERVTVTSSPRDIDSTPRREAPPVPTVTPAPSPTLSAATRTRRVDRRVAEAPTPASRPGESHVETTPTVTPRAPAPGPVASAPAAVRRELPRSTVTPAEEARVQTHAPSAGAPAPRSSASSVLTPAPRQHGAPPVPVVPRETPSPAVPIPAAAPAETTHVEVRIGRIEVRAVTDAPPARVRPAPRHTPKLSLEEYLKQRGRGRP